MSERTKHPARGARQTIGAASAAAFVGAAIGIATGGGNGTVQPANAAQTPAASNSTPATSQPTSPFDQNDGGWGATAPNDGNGFQAGGGSGGSFGGGSPQSHSQSGAS